MEEDRERKRGGERDRDRDKMNGARRKTKQEEARPCFAGRRTGVAWCGPVHTITAASTSEEEGGGDGHQPTLNWLPAMVKKGVKGRRERSKRSEQTKVFALS